MRKLAINTEHITIKEIKKIVLKLPLLFININYEL